MWLFDLLLNVHGKQLRSCWDGQVLNHTGLDKPLGAYLAPILSNVNATQRQREIFTKKNVPYARIDLECK